MNQQQANFKDHFVWPANEVKNIQMILGRKKVPHTWKLETKN